MQEEEREEARDKRNGRNSATIMTPFDLPLPKTGFSNLKRSFDDVRKTQYVNAFAIEVSDRAQSEP
jgi:hypothetical protein